MLTSANSANLNIEYQKMSTTHLTTNLGLLTTVAQLPPKYKIRYLARAALLETPLDLTVKQDVCAFLQQRQQQQHEEQQIQQQQQQENIKKIENFQTDKIKNEKSNELLINNKNEYEIINQHPITPPPSPPKKRYRDDGYQSSDSEINSLQITKIIEYDVINSDIKNIKKEIWDNEQPQQQQKTPTKPIKIINSAPRTGKSNNSNINREKKTTTTKAIRKLKFDEDTSSPVSGTIIRTLEEIKNSGEDIQSGDIDPEYNIVEVTDEAKQELSQIKNFIGSYTCKLCCIEFDDAFGLARHRCSCIVLLEYRCPECGKRFNCPANLASHRRWHKPKDEILKKQLENNNDNLNQYPCNECGKNFKRQAYLRKHLTTHKHKEESIKRKNMKTSKNYNNRKKLQKLNNNTISIILNDNDDAADNNIDNDHNIIEDSNYSRPSSIPNSLSSNSNLNYNHNDNFSNNTNSLSKYDYDEYSETTRSDCSSPGRLQIIDEHNNNNNNLTEEENIAAAALAHLRNGPSVIQHTTATIVY